MRAGWGLPEDGPLFCTSDGAAVTVDMVRDEVKALMQTINSLRLKAERAKQQATTAGRGRRVQSQLRKIKQLELCVEYLKEQLASASNSRATRRTCISLSGAHG